MKNIKKIIIGIIALTMIVSLCSCVDNKKGNTAEGEKSVKWITAYSKPKAHDEVLKAVNEKMNDKIGATLDLMVMDSGAFSEKMNLMISSNEEFDVCFTSNWLNTYTTNVKKKAFLQLDDMLDSTPDLKQAVPQYVWDSVKTNGGIYGVPNLQVMFTRIDACFMPSLVEKYNIDVDSIKTLKDMEPVLKTIKGNEPNLIPYQPSWTPLAFNYEGFDGQIYADKSGKGGFKTVYEIPEYQEYLRMVHEWYQKGYIPSDIMTSSGYDSSIVATMLSTYKPGVEESEIAKNGFKYERATLSEPYVSATIGQNTMNAISATSKDPELALKAIELIYTDKDIYNTLCFGLEGTHYEKIGDNQVKRISEDYVFNSGWLFGNQFNAYLTENQETTVWDDTVKMNNEAIKSPYLGFNFNIDNVKNQIASVNAVQAEYEKFMKYGVEDPAKHWDTYVQKLKAAGIEKIKSEIEAQYNEWKKSN